ncbi:MAG: hypothetical protein ACK4K7_04255 [Allosphingosinicella sp.]|uniref:hypothetical protein n=1 Tax=Allosphingosinicella sp. TaxID=2823234 RepID=UPI00394C3F8F
MEALVTNTYRGAFLSVLGGSERHLASCIRIARSARIYELVRDVDYSRFDDQMRTVEAHVADDLARFS